MVVVGADVHKRTHTFVAVDEVGRTLCEKFMAATGTGHAELMADPPRTGLSPNDPWPASAAPPSSFRASQMCALVITFDQRTYAAAQAGASNTLECEDLPAARRQR
jgi:hypothetical protein